VWLNFGYSLDGFSLPREPIIAADIQQMQADGFTHFRVFLFTEQWLGRYASAAQIQANFAQLDADLDVWLAEGMAVTLTLGSMRPADAADLLGTEAGRTEVASFGPRWQLATPAATRSCSRSRIYNEPNSVPGAWRATALPVRAAGLARLPGCVPGGDPAAAPTHTVLVTSSRYSVHDALIRFEPYADGNLVYVFHYYCPNVFSFQSKPPSPR
jgi:hypothetical protein